LLCRHVGLRLPDVLPCLRPVRPSSVGACLHRVPAFVVESNGFGRGRLKKGPLRETCRAVSASDRGALVEAKFPWARGAERF